MKKILLFVAALGCSADCAHASTKEIVREISQIQGIEKILDDAKLAGEQQARAAIENAVAQMRQTFPEISKEALDDVRDAGGRLLSSLEESYSVKEILDVWESKYAEGIDEDHALRVLEYLKSEAGKKDIVASKAAAAAMQQALMQKMSAAMNVGMTEYIKTIQAIANRERARTTKR